MRSRIIRLAIVAALAVSAAAAAAVEKGPVTGLKLPRYVSLKSGEANVRRGPGLSHRVDWVFLRRGMPLQITAEHGNWRRVRDMDGATGWVHYSLLRGNRSAVVTAEKAGLMAEPRADADVVAWLEAGVIMSLDSCDMDWCEAETQGYAGWIEKSAIWGVDPDETFH